MFIYAFIVMFILLFWIILKYSFTVDASSISLKGAFSNVAIRFIFSSVVSEWIGSQHSFFFFSSIIILLHSMRLYPELVFSSYQLITQILFVSQPIKNLFLSTVYSFATHLLSCSSTLGSVCHNLS